jgi:hypothetical protein
MPEAVSVDPSDRLPWLSDPAPPPKQRPASGKVQAFAGWAVAGALAIAWASYWLGAQSGQQQPPRRVANPVWTGSGTTLKLPQPDSAVEPQISIAKTPEVKPTPAPDVRMPAQAAPRPAQEPERRAAAPPESSKPIAQASSNAAPITRAPVFASRPKPLTLWPSRQVNGANGRLVQIGAFGSPQQAKLGWRHMQRAYPAVGRLPAVVVPTRNSKGRKFYRFQIGTTSQAHSEVLCQRMKSIGLSCAVIGLPWKEKVER